MGLADCAFETERLSAGGWHSIAFEGSAQGELADVVADMLTAAVTRSLPEQWSGNYSVDRARGWIAERDDEGVTLLVLDRSSRRHAATSGDASILSQETTGIWDSTLPVRLAPDGC